MPIISPNDKVLLTGSNGFVGLWIIKTLLERGYSVRAAVRTESKGGRLKEIFKDYDSELELVIVPDMTAEGIWDEAVKGVHAIVHAATPVDLSDPMPKPETFIDPAVKGVTRVLESAARNLNIKRVVMISSMAAVTSDVKTPRLYTEEDWNDAAVEVVRDKGDQAGAGIIYAASKVLAERAAWAFYKDNKTQISWELTTLTPPLVVGPPLGIVSTPADLNGSLFMLWMYLLSDDPKTRDASVILDVRDLAELHVRALEAEQAGGERIFATPNPFVWQDLLNVANSLNLPNRKFQAGLPGVGSYERASVSTEKAQRIFGETFKYRSTEETIKDTLDAFAKSGF